MQEFLKCTFLPAELERWTKALEVCFKATDQNFDCGCNRYAILRLDLLFMGVTNHLTEVDWTGLDSRKRQK